MFTKYKSIIIVIFIFVSFIQILLIFNNRAEDQESNLSSRLLVFKLDDSFVKNDKDISIDVQYEEQGGLIDSIFDDDLKLVNHTKSEIEVKSSLTTTSSTPRLSSTTTFLKFFNISFKNKNKNGLTLKSKTINHSKINFTEALQKIQFNQTLESLLIKSSTVLFLTKKKGNFEWFKEKLSNKNRNKFTNQLNVLTDGDIEKDEVTMDTKLQSNTSTLKNTKTIQVKISKNWRNSQRLKKKSKAFSTKEKFNYNENDRQMYNFFNKINKTNLKNYHKNDKLFDTDEDVFAGDSLKNNILNEDEELPLLDKTITQQHVNTQNLFTNDSIKIISMSLYGDQKRYTIGAIRNAELIKIYFPGWRLRIYMEHKSMAHHGQVPQSIVEQLINLDVEIVYVDNEVRHMQPMMWRFLVADDLAVDIFLIRDCDSRLNERDAAATYAWLQTKAAFYCTRDHPSHAEYSISGGLWGGKTKLLKNILRHTWLDIMLSDRSYGKGGYFVDMAFLQNRIWKKVERFTYCSDSVSCDKWVNAHPFPLRRRGYEHVGQVFDENENVRPIDIRIMRRTGENEYCLPSNRLF